jgi:hypothetical protein
VDVLGEEEVAGSGGAGLGKEDLLGARVLGWGRRSTEVLLGVKELLGPNSRNANEDDEAEMKDEGSDVISVNFHLVGTFPKRLIFRNGGSTSMAPCSIEYTTYY